MTLTSERDFSLEDRYKATTGEILATGIQALVRLPMDQMRADNKAGHKTATFISGYRGSPLGRYDYELAAQKELLDQLNIKHLPGLNEELAATSLMGSQLVSLMPKRRYEGVVGIWYGKGPGVDRAGDAIRHGNFAGTSRLGGVVVLAGDDSACKSSTIPTRSEPLLSALGLPVLYPGSIQEVLDFGHHAIEISRCSGLWVGMKIATPIADGTGVATIDPDRLEVVRPNLEVDGKPFIPTLTGLLVSPFSTFMESEVLDTRMEMARLYISANQINKIPIRASKAWLTIVAGGLDAVSVTRALEMLGLDSAQAREAGIRVLALGALHPTDTDALREAAGGVETVLVVEDKAPWLQTKVCDALYGAADHPSVIGKTDEEGRPLLASSGAVSAEGLLEPLRRILLRKLPEERLAPQHEPKPRLALSATVSRTPYFCSGCPHNTSTRVPDGSLVGAGIGCHTMVATIANRDRGQIIGLTQMGGEGAEWIGMEPFVEDEHLFQNMGDGTYFHSGQLAIQAAIAAGSHITFKLLYNSAVAMTGGQHAEGNLGVPALAAKLLTEGVRKVIVTTEDLGRYKGIKLPPGVQVWHRDRIIEAQEELRNTPGVTVLIHDQQCAAEKRRERKRGILPSPALKVVIDERICEGCGDCGIQSNCLSLVPLDTEFGRKTTIDQTSCNLDMSCMKGDCPAFVTIKPSPRGSRGSIARARGEQPGTPGQLPEELPEPASRPRTQGITVRMPGVGGTGVITVSQILAVASRMCGLSADCVDQTGLSQKAGPVVSTVHIGDTSPATVEVMLGFDLLTATTESNLAGLVPGVSVVIGSTSISPTGSMIGKVASSRIDLDAYLRELDSRSTPEANRYADAQAITRGLLGSSLTANMFLLGVAYQAGTLPVTAESIENAIELNGAAVNANVAAFRWGRAWYLDPESVERAAGLRQDQPSERNEENLLGLLRGLDELQGDEELARIVRIRALDLVDYQDRRYAQRYVDFIRRSHARERQLGLDGGFTRVVAHQLHRLMAYKDEYEVARLMLSSQERIEASVGPVEKIAWHLHPPALRARGLKKKISLGTWALPAMSALRASKGLRGTPLDPFGRTPVRREERRLASEYRELIEELMDSVLPRDPENAARIANLIDMVRGYENVKLGNLQAYREALSAELDKARSITTGA